MNRLELIGLLAQMKEIKVECCNSFRLVHVYVLKLFYQLYFSEKMTQGDAFAVECARDATLWKLVEVVWTHLKQIMHVKTKKQRHPLNNRRPNFHKENTKSF